MQLSEFKAWFEGYTEGLEGAPTKAQFERIKEKVKEKVKEISGTPITSTVYIDRYYEPYRRYWASWGGATGIGLSSSGGTMRSADGTQYTFTNSGETDQFDSHAAMYALGKAEASLAA